MPFIEHREKWQLCRVIHLLLKWTAKIYQKKYALEIPISFLLGTLPVEMQISNQICMRQTQAQLQQLSLHMTIHVWQ